MNSGGYLQFHLFVRLYFSIYLGLAVFCQQTNATMVKFQIAAFLGVFLGYVGCFSYGISVSCMMPYEEGGASAVFSSLECTQWVLAAESSRNSTSNCQFATFQGRRGYQEDRITCNLEMQIPFLGKNGPEEAAVGVAAVFDGHGGKEASEMASERLADFLLLHTMFNSYNQSVPSNGENNEADAGCFTQKRVMACS